MSEQTKTPGDDGSPMPDATTIAALGAFLQAVVEDRVTLVPLAHGDIQIEYHDDDGHKVEIAFMSTGFIVGIWSPPLSPPGGAE